MGRRAHILSISLTDSFKPTERQLSTRFGGGVPRRRRRLENVSYTAVRREHNTLADRLVNDALDAA